MSPPIIPRDGTVERNSAILFKAPLRRGYIGTALITTGITQADSTSMNIQRSPNLRVTGVFRVALRVADEVYLACSDILTGNRRMEW